MHIQTHTHTVVGRDLHLQKAHPLKIIKAKIEAVSVYIRKHGSMYVCMHPCVYVLQAYECVVFV